MPKVYMTGPKKKKAVKKKVATGGRGKQRKSADKKKTKYT